MERHSKQNRWAQLSTTGSRSTSRQMGQLSWPAACPPPAAAEAAGFSDRTSRRVARLDSRGEEKNACGSSSVAACISHAASPKASSRWRLRFFTALTTAR